MPSAPLVRSPAGRSGGQRRLGLLHDRAERAAFVHRQIGHDLPVELDPGELGAVHELRVGQALGANRRVDPLDPQRAEAALLHLAVAIGVLAGLLDGLAGDADGVLAAAAIALGLLEDPLVLGARGYTTLDLAARRELEALLDAALGLQLGHFRLLVRDTSNQPWQPLWPDRQMNHVSVKGAPLGETLS